MKEVCKTAAFFARLFGVFRAYQRLNAQKLLTDRLPKLHMPTDKIFNIFLIQTSGTLTLAQTSMSQRQSPKSIDLLFARELCHRMLTKAVIRLARQ